MDQDDLGLRIFRLDVVNASLRQEEQPILLTPKASLCFGICSNMPASWLPRMSWRVVWPGISVTDAALTMCVSELRKALGNDPGHAV